MLPPFEVDEYPWSAIFSPSRDGKFVALGGQVLRLWNVQTGEKVESFDIDVYSFALSPDGTCIRKLGKVRFSNMMFMNLSQHYNT